MVKIKAVAVLYEFIKTIVFTQAFLKLRLYKTQMKAYKKFQREKIPIVASVEVDYFTMIVGQLSTDGS